MLILFFVICGLIHWSHAVSVPLENCIPWAGQLNITAVRIPNCETEPCLMRIQVPLNVEIDFIPSISLDSVQAQASLSSFGNYFFIELSPLEEVCHTLDAHFQCPVEADHTYTISSKFLVGVEPGESTKLPNTFKVDVRISGIKNDAAEITDCSINLTIDH